MARKPSSEGYEGWDEYAPFYDWENARTLGRRDVPFWRTLASEAGGAVLELGCGTGRVAIPLGRAGIRLIGIDRSEPMIARARQRLARVRWRRRVSLVRGDIRDLPFRVSAFGMVMAPYGILQSLLRDRELAATLAAVRGVLKPGGTFGLELVADLPSWKEYRKRVSLTGWRRRRGGAAGTLVGTARHGPGPAAPCLRPGVHRAARARAPHAPVCADLPYALGASDGSAAREGRLRDHGATGRLPRSSVGSQGRGMGHSRASLLERSGRIHRYFSAYCLEFPHVWPF